jgi:translation elongation factor EF-Ts
MVHVDNDAAKWLAEKSHASFHECQVALTEANGDPSKAFEILLNKGLVKGSEGSSNEIYSADPLNLPGAMKSTHKQPHQKP